MDQFCICTYIYHKKEKQTAKMMPNVGKCISPMDPMGDDNSLLADA